VLEDEASYAPMVVDPTPKGSRTKSSKIKTGPFEKKCMNLKFIHGFNGSMKT